MKKIGVKLADGSFYPLLKEGIADKKKIALSTVKDNQTTVKVDLYASEESSMADAILIDTLQITDLEKQPNGQPEINLSASIDKNNIIQASILDSDSKARASDTVNLREALLAADKNPGSGKGLLAAAQEINDRDNSEEKKLAGELDDFAFDIPAFSEGEAPKTEIVVDEPKAKKSAPEKTDIGFEETSVADVPADNLSADDFPAKSASLDEPFDQSLDMPDFDVPAFEDSTSAASSSSDELKFDDNEFDLPNFDDGSSSSSSSDDFGDSFTDTFDDSSSSAASADASSSLDFGGLYDEDDEGEKEKKGRLPVLICLICAVICVIAVLLMLFVIPSKFNVIKSNSSQSEAAQARSEPLPPPVKKEEPLPPPPPEPELPAPAAKVDEIVVVEEAENVVPDLPKVEEKRAPKVITYKIKWGDTLWDIADAYYKNPWRYPKIAKYNGIKNPNHIVAGTYIKIPEE